MAISAACSISSLRAVERGDQAAGGHRAGDADLALAADLGAGDAGVLLVEDADGGGGEEVADEAGVGLGGGELAAGQAGDEAEIVLRDGGDDAGGAVGGGGDDAASGGVLLVDGHGVDGDPVDGRERVLGAAVVETLGEAVGAAADVEASGKNALGRDAALDGLLHGAPEGEDAGLDLLFGRRCRVGGCAGGTRDGERGIVEERDLVGQQQFGDGELVLGGELEQLCGAAERIGHVARWGADGRGAGGGGVLGLGDDEAAADGVEDLLRERRAGGVEGGEAHAVGMRGLGGGGIHLVAMEEQVLRPREGDGVAAEEVEGVGCGDAVERGFDLRGIDLIGGFAEEAEQDGAVGGVADAGEREGAVEIDGDAGGAVEVAVGCEVAGEAEGGTHGADGMGAGGADPNLEKFK